MHIKKVIIQGFGSYAKAENPELFMPGVNAILGVNGSGKSNFFKAIQFVLSPKYMKIDEEKMRELYYKGRSDAVTTARVDIVFDNTDERFPIESDEVTIRRTIGGNVDSFYVNNRLYSKSEMESFLETAGFSRDNPYYMVEQGSVKQLCELSDEGRLRLLKEVAGTRVYEERRRESESILEDTKLKVAQVRDLIDEMNHSLQVELGQRVHTQELETEKEALEEYEQYDRERRICVYFLASTDIREKEEEINRCNVNRKTLADKLAELHAQYDQALDTVQQAEESLAGVVSEVSSVETTAAQLETERRSLLREVTSLELDLSELRTSLAQQRTRREQSAISSGRILEEIGGCQQRLETEVAPALEEATATAAQADAALTTKQGHLEMQRSRRRWQRQGSPEEQAQAQARELEPLERDVAAKASFVSSTRQQLSNLQQDIGALEASLQGRTLKKSELSGRQTALRSQLSEVRESLESVTAERKRLWRQNEDLTAELEKENAAFTKESGDLNRLIPGDTRSGLEGLEAVPGVEPGSVLGPVANLFQPKQERFLTALENTAGSRLFQVVVRDDAVAAQIVSHFRSQRTGRVTLLPVEQMRGVVKEPRFPEDTRCYPLLKCIEFDETVRPVMVSIFGSTLLCEDLRVATEVAKEYNMNCITLAGEKVGKRGAMRGGYFDARSSRLRLWRNVQQKQDGMKRKKDEQEDIKRKLEGIHKQELDLLARETQITSSARLISSTLATLVGEERETLDRLQHLTERRDQLATSLSSAETALRSAQTRVEQLHQEMEAPEALLDDAAIEALEKEVVALQQTLMEATQRMEGLRLERVRLETRVTLLRKQALDLEQAHVQPDSQVGSTSEFTEDASATVEAQEAQLQRRREELAHVQQDLASLEERRVALVRQRDSEQEKMERAKSEEETLESQIGSLRNRMQELLQKRNNAMGLLEEKRRDVSVLSSIPAGAERYREYSASRLKSLLSKANKHLLKFDKVNRKAMSQYLLFSERRSEFQKRHEELEEGMKSIHKLIDTLDERKNEAIVRTFKQVGMHFKDAFQEIVPNGTAELIIRKENPESEEFNGVGIRVRFGGGGESLRMGQLSGGQKAVVALALIFAIQRADPAPFYLLDEVDAELDTQYRLMVAKLVRKQADQQKDVQIFCTTFKPEILEEADYFYRVTLKNDASRIEKTTKEEALEFVQTRLSAKPTAAAQQEEEPAPSAN
ncbi:hypothetical protein WA538_000196 [Blastocystis sp. DL]